MLIVFATNKLKIQKVILPFTVDTDYVLGNGIIFVETEK